MRGLPVSGRRVQWAEAWCPALGSGLLSESYRIHSCSVGGWAVLALSSWTPGLENPPLLSALVSSTPPPLNRGLLACLASFSFCSKQAAGTLLVGEGRASAGRQEQSQCQIASCSQPTCPANLVHMQAQTCHTHTCVCVCVCVCRQRYMHAVSGTCSWGNAGTLVHTYTHIPACRHTLQGAHIPSRGSDPEAEALRLWPGRQKRFTSFRMRVSR